MSSIKNKDLKIIFIAGSGHSGSTLLDIMLGSPPGFFSAGAVAFITRPGIKDEFCSCGQKVKDCEVWSKVWKIWDRNREMPYDEFCELRLRYERNKTTLQALKNKLTPGKDFLRYCVATRQLFEAIQEVTGAKVIIDSSKAPQRITTLNQIADLTVVHVCREFKGVLNSSKKATKKNLNEGVEVDLPARPTMETLLRWPANNLLCELFNTGVKSKKVKYREYIKHSESLVNIHPAYAGISNKAYFEPGHLIAGNRLRLKKKLDVNPNLGFSYERLNKGQMALAKTIDKLFWFWA